MSQRKRWIVAMAVACVCAMSSVAWAQQTTPPPASPPAPKIDTSPEEPPTSFSLGYSFMRDNAWKENLLFGFYGSVAHRISTYLSIVGEASLSIGEYQTSGFMIQRFGALGGVRLAGGEGEIRPFFQALAGYARQGGDVGLANGIAVQPGGGVDLIMNERVTLRAQGDYRFLREDSNNYNQFRISVGFVWTIGKKNTK